MKLSELRSQVQAGFVVICVGALALCATQNLSADDLSTVVPESTTRSVCEAWLNVIVAQDSDWAGSRHPFVLSVHDLQDGDRVVGRYYRIDPEGFVIVSARRHSPPIKAYSDTGGGVLDSKSGIAAMARDELARSATQYEALLAAGETVALAEIDELLGASTTLWNQLTGIEQTAPEALAKSLELTQEIGPLLSSEWDQGFPYDDLCPWVGDSHCPVGCVATAAAQLMYYWKWPYAGKGTHSYYWELGGRTLEADFSDPYAWELMGNKWGSGWSGESEDAVAELTYEVAVALEMRFAPNGSGTKTEYLLTALPKYFGYSSQVTVERREKYEASTWFELIREELANLAPLLYTIYSHAVVCDGYREREHSGEIHLNYGWSGSHNAWYVPDEHFCARKDESPNCHVIDDHILVNIRPEHSDELEVCAQIISTSNSANESTVLRPGDSGVVNLTWYNKGSDIYRLNATYESLTPGLTVSTRRSEVATDLKSNATVTLAAAADVQIGSEIEASTSARLAVLSTSSKGILDVDTLEILIVDENDAAFEQLQDANLWNFRSLTPGHSGTWCLNSELGPSRMPVWSSRECSASEYEDFTDAGLISPQLLLGPGSRLSFFSRMEAELDTIPGFVYDGGIVFVQEDGCSWEPITPDGGYPFRITADYESGSFWTPLAHGTPCLSGATDWQQLTFDLAQYSGTVGLMFRFTSDGLVTGRGWDISDVRITSGLARYDRNCDGRADIIDVVMALNELFVETSGRECYRSGGSTNFEDGPALSLQEINELLEYLFEHGI